MKWISSTAPTALFLALLAPPVAAADGGGPVPPVQGSYIRVPGSPYGYAALDARGNTTVKVQRAGAGAAVSALRVSGRYGIPGVDYGGSMTGLSADGRTLVLAELVGNSQPRTTRLIVLDTPRLAVRTRIALRGWSTVDAISPGGRWLYLIHYPASDLARYEVLAYDLALGRLLAKPVIDPRDRDEAMTGAAITRVTSHDGRWAYTLYLRPSGVPFVHALDTARVRAVCVDLPSLGNVDIGGAHLQLTSGGETLRLDVGGVTRAAIDTRTLRVRTRVHRGAAARIRSVSHSDTAARRKGDLPWELIVLSIVALGMIGLAGAGVARSGRHATSDRGPDGSPVMCLDTRHGDGDPADEEVPVA